MVPAVAAPFNETKAAGWRAARPAHQRVALAHARVEGPQRRVRVKRLQHAETEVTRVEHAARRLVERDHLLGAGLDGNFFGRRPQRRVVLIAARRGRLVRDERDRRE